MNFSLPELPYAHNALEPVISQKTIEYHYGKHHQAYINNLNNLIKGTEFENKTLEEIIQHADGAIYNNAAQAWNHTFYFQSFTAQGKQKPEGKLLEAIQQQWGTFEQFQNEFAAAATSLFGSGWAWLVVNQNKQLEITKEPNAGNPLTKQQIPLLTFDVWEHAYYLDYQNQRPEHIKQLWNIIDWNVIEKRYGQAVK